MEDKKKVLFLVNHEVVIYNFRLELVERLLHDGYEVHISTPEGKRIEKLKLMGAIIHPIEFNRHGMNPFDDYKILKTYKSLIREIKPTIVFGYTIKPNIYGALACRNQGVPFVANITGLGTAVENGGLKQLISVLLYRISFGTSKGRIQRVFFQNEENELFFKTKRIALDKHAILPGSGVNTERFPYRDMQSCGDGKTGNPIRFAFISRIMKEKGIDYYLDAAEIVKKEYPNTEFHVCGFFEEEYDRTRFDELEKIGTIIYDGNVENISDFLNDMHCVIHPTYYPEGLSNVLLEASSTGRPIITTNRAGCREVVDGNGFLFEIKDLRQLVERIRVFINLDFDDKRMLGIKGRNLVEKRFDRQIIVDAYLNELKESIGKNE